MPVALRASIFNAEGQVIACLVVVGPVQRMHGDKIEAFKKLVVEYAGEISGLEHRSTS